MIVLEAGRSKIKALDHSVSGEGPLPRQLLLVFLLQAHVVKIARELSGASFTRALIPSLMVHDLTRLPKAPHPNFITLAY